jgi:hypothetical protein
MWSVSVLWLMAMQLCTMQLYSVQGKGILATLTKGVHGMEEARQKSIEKNMYKAGDMDVVIFHELISPAQMQTIQSYTPNMIITFINVNSYWADAIQANKISLAKDVNPICVAKEARSNSFPPGYKAMCQFW